MRQKEVVLCTLLCVSVWFVESAILSNYIIRSADVHAQAHTHTHISIVWTALYEMQYKDTLKVKSVCATLDKMTVLKSR